LSSFDSDRIGTGLPDGKPKPDSNQNTDLGKFGDPCNGRCCYFLCPIGLFYGAIWYFLWPLVFFMVIWFVAHTKKNLATLNWTATKNAGFSSCPRLWPSVYAEADLGAPPSPDVSELRIDWVTAELNNTHFISSIK
jgi:hypothetical protein